MFKLKTCMMVLIAVVGFVGCAQTKKDEEIIESSSFEISLEMDHEDSIEVDTKQDGQTAAKQMNDLLFIEGEKNSDNTKGMALYSEVVFSYAGAEWVLQKYIQDDMLIDGELAMDDNAHFLIQAISNGYCYVLFDEAVWLGEPSADVWVDLDNRLHISLKDVRTARYSITDYVYQAADHGDSDAGGFVEQTVMAADGINFLGAVE